MRGVSSFKGDLMSRDTSGPKNEPQYAGTGAPADAADLSEIATYAALVGNRKTGTTAQRNAATGTSAAWEGLLWGDTTDGYEYRYTSGAWVGGTTPFTFVGLYGQYGGTSETVKAVVQGGRVWLEGFASNVSSATFVAATQYTLGTIPVSLAPTKAQSFSCTWGDTGTASVTVDAAGNVTFLLNVGAAGVAAGGFRLSLSGISWRTK
jgi:hypothetical protein